jgi:hypothetical protein
MTERQGRSLAATGIVVGTLVVTTLLGVCAMGAGALGMSGADPTPVMIGFGVAAAAVLVGGSTIASIVAWRHREGTPTPAPARLSAVEPLASPFRFFATGSAAVLAPDPFRWIAGLEKGGEYTAVAASGAWVLVEDALGRRGWVPDTVVPARVWRRQKRAGNTATGAGEGGGDG